MCKTAILPVLVKSENTNNYLIHLTYVFNRWMKMLENYGKLDASTINDDYNVISKVLRLNNISKDTKRYITQCRDYALVETSHLQQFAKALRKAIKFLCKEQEDSSIKQLISHYANQGMTERYRPLSKRLEHEKIRRIGKKVMYTDYHVDDATTTKLVRRIVEKRAAQMVHHISSKEDRDSNRYRQNLRRATSFSLYNASFVDYDAKKRTPGTHWKVYRNHAGHSKRLKAKHSYNTYEEAIAACERYVMNHPGDSRAMSAYKCDHCNKWHIGHDRAIITSIEESTSIAS